MTTKAPSAPQFCTLDRNTRFLCMSSSLQVPQAMKEGSFFCEEMLSLEFFSWSFYKLLSGDSSMSLKPFCLQRVLNILPAPLTVISSVWGHGCGRGDDGNVSGSVSRRLLDVAPRELAGGRGLWWSLWLTGQERRKNNLVIQSVLFFFFFFCTNSWTPLKRQCESV